MRAFGEEIKQKLHLTVSIGVSVYPKDAQYKSDLMAKCEKTENNRHGSMGQIGLREM